MKSPFLNLTQVLYSIVLSAKTLPVTWKSVTAKLIMQA